MKRFVVLLLVLLLPLRGWAGDLMGVRMAGMDLTMAVMAAQGAVADADAAMPPGCPMHAAMQHGHGHGHGDEMDHASADAGMDDVASPHAFADGDHKPDKPNCASCDLCLPLAAFACARLDLVTLLRDGKPVISVDDFASALLAPAHKPPIA